MAVTVSFVGFGSGQTTGQAVSITATSTPGTTVHTYSGAGTDFIKLWLTNTSTSAVLATVEWGNATTTNNIMVTVPPQSGPILVVDRRGISVGSGTVKVFAATTAVIMAWAEVWNAV